MVAILAKLATFRGQSRLITWAYRFVVLEVAGKLARLASLLAAPGCGARLRGVEGYRTGTRWIRAHTSSLPSSSRRCAARSTAHSHQRRVFVAIVVDGVALDALMARLGVSHNALYEVVFDARPKIRSTLVADGYLDEGRDGP